MIVRRRSLVRVKVRVDAWLARPIESGLELSRDARVRGVNVRAANVRGRSVSEPDMGECSAAKSSLKLRLMLPRLEEADGLDMTTSFSFEWTELSEFDLLSEDPASAKSTVVGVTAVVAVGCLMTEGREGSARTVTCELVDTLRRLLSDIDAAERRLRRDSEGNVGKDGGIANGGSALVRSDCADCRPAGVGDGS